MPDFVVDESLPLSAVAALREQGHRAHHVGDVGLRGSPDETIFARAQEEGRIIVTRDLGFGNLVDYPLGTHAGIIVLRVPSIWTAGQIRDLLSTFASDVEPEMLHGALAIVEPGRYRIRQPQQR
jgi:predicted nuclease of predicted toxin-antitoxin system